MPYKSLYSGAIFIATEILLYSASVKLLPLLGRFLVVKVCSNHGERWNKHS